MSKFFEKQMEDYEDKKAEKVVNELNAVGCNVSEFARTNNISRGYANYLIKKYKIKRKTVAYIDKIVFLIYSPLISLSQSSLSLISFHFGVACSI